MDRDDPMEMTHRRVESPKRDRDDYGGLGSGQERMSEAPTDTVRRAAEAVSDDATNMAEVLGRAWSGALKDVAEYTRTQPGAALAMAAGLGFLMGRLTASAGGRARDLASEGGVHWPPRLESTS
jgi:hypothetical protein